MPTNPQTTLEPPESTIDVPIQRREFHFSTKHGHIEWFADMRPVAGGVRALEFHQFRGDITSVPNSIEIPRDRTRVIPH